MSKFKVGDRVVYDGGINDMPKMPKNSRGTIISVERNVCGIRFDDHVAELHSCWKLCEDGHGWWVFNYDYDHLKLLKADEERRFNVIITSVGDVTTAKLLHGKKLEKEVSVKRYHKDEYSEKEAVKNVCAKLFGEDKPEKEPEPVGINCKAVCIDDDDYSFLTRGKIYEFSDGKCVDDDGDFYPIFVGYKITNYSEPLFADNFVKLVDEI